MNIFSHVNINMNTLPYETQFKYLVHLSFNDTLNYCLTNTTAYSICQTEAFWTYKARKMYGIDLNLPSEQGYGTADIFSKKYQLLEERYNNDEDFLIFLLAENGQLKRVPLLFKTLNPYSKANLLTEMIGIVLTKHTLVLLEQLLDLFKDELIVLVNTGDINDVLRSHYFNALLQQRMDIINILGRYYNPVSDNKRHDEINSNFVQGQVRMLYYDALLKNKMDVFNIVRNYYQPEYDYSTEFANMIKQWSREANPRTLALLRGVGVDI